MSGAPGRLNRISDVPGIRVGHAADAAARTGVSVILPDMRVAASVDVRGGGPGTRETDLLRPEAMVQEIDALCLAGGSVFGLDAASGVTHWLARQGRGHPVHHLHVPIVPAAILFDLLNGGEKDWPDESPYRRLGQAACEAAKPDFTLGNAGAGYGAAAGKLKGGIGSASWASDDGLIVGALVAVNAVGSVLTPGNKAFWAAPWEQGTEFGGLGVDPASGAIDHELPLESRIGGHTCIGAVATNARLDKTALRHIAAMAQDGLARTIRPVHTPFDGDTLFALSAPSWREQSADMAALPRLVARIGSIAADCVARAVARGVWEAEPLGALNAARHFLKRVD